MCRIPFLLRNSSNSVLENAGPLSDAITSRSPRAANDFLSNSMVAVDVEKLVG